jgi:hypothetical protein
MAAKTADNSEDVRRHHTVVDISPALPSEVAVAGDLAFQVRVTCAAGCDLRGASVTITNSDGTTRAELTTFETGANQAAPIMLKAPLSIGEHTWHVDFASQETGGTLHEQATLPLVVRTRPHETSLAVWAVPSPVVMGERFGIKVGAKSSFESDLSGRDIEVHDQSGTVVARGTLQETRWPGTSALYWTEVDLLAPASEGICSWSVQFAAAALETPHISTNSAFSFVVVKPPDHKMTVKVVEKDTGNPVENAQVRLGAYRAATDQHGLAEVMLCKGTYDLSVWKVGYDAPPQTVAVDDDAMVEVRLLMVPEENPDAAWLM